MKEVVIVDGARTPIGVFGGALKDITAQDLAATVIKELVKRNNLKPPCGICGTDLKKIHMGSHSAPRIFGHEMAGTVAAVGEGVTRFAVGNSVMSFHHVPCGECYYCCKQTPAQCPLYKKTGATAGFEPSGGGFAEYIRIMDFVVQNRGVVPIPDGVPFEQAAFVECADLSTVTTTAARAGVRPPARAAKMAKATIWRGIASSPKRLAPAFWQDLLNFALNPVVSGVARASPQFPAILPDKLRQNR